MAETKEVRIYNLAISNLFYSHQSSSPIQCHAHAMYIIACRELGIDNSSSSSYSYQDANSNKNPSGKNTSKNHSLTGFICFGAVNKHTSHQFYSDKFSVPPAHWFHFAVEGF
jgi:hypothetical protein